MTADNKAKWLVWDAMKVLEQRHRTADTKEERETLWAGVIGLDKAFRLLWGNHVPWSAGSAEDPSTLMASKGGQ